MYLGNAYQLFTSENNQKNMIDEKFKKELNINAA